ncbi:MAG: tetratricopeptide repeat protein [Acidobacteria bacterium]|nr:tetratricopeptide repeat protein [Acidobacteriota bacterium]
MSYVRKVASIGAVASMLLAGSVLLSGGMAWSAQDTLQQMSVEQQAAQKNVKNPKSKAPLTEKELIKLVKHHKKDLSALGPEIESRGLGFEVTPDIEQSLRKAGADDNFIAAIKNFTPSARAKGASGPQVSPAEAQAYNQLKGEQDPDKIIQDANAFAKNFPNSSVLTYVYSIAAVAYQQKNDAENVVLYGERSLALKPDNLMALLLVSSTLPQPQMLNVSDAEKEKRLTLAEVYANKALQEIDQIGKQASETDQAFQARKDQMASGAYSSLGMVHLERSRMAIQEPDLGELAKAEQNYKTAIEKSGGNDAVDYYRLGEVYSSEGKVDEAIAAFSNASKQAPGTVIEQYANRQIQALKQKKSEAKANAKP